MRRVLIVESPGLADITSGDRRGELIKRQLELLRIPCVLQAIHTSTLFEDVLKGGAPESDVIHLSAHGNTAGIGFTDGSFLDWKKLQIAALPHTGGKLLVLDACQSAAFNVDANLAKFMQQMMGGVAQPPKCVLTMVGNVYFADSVLAWGLFYRRLAQKLNGAPVVQTDAHHIKEALDSVKGAQLPKICASYWYDEHGKYKNISPWLGGPVSPKP